VQCRDNVTFRMTKSLGPFRFLLIALSGWMNQQQLQLIDYLREENRVLREQLGQRRSRFNDDQRRRLAVRAKGLGRKLLREVATIVTPETVLAWHHRHGFSDRPSSSEPDTVEYGPSGSGTLPDSRIVHGANWSIVILIIDAVGTELSQAWINIIGNALKPWPGTTAQAYSHRRY
jgi:hypothetical protein